MGKVAKRVNSHAPRGIKKTRLAQESFLEALKRTGLVTEACEIVGIARRTPYDWSRKSEEFAEAMDAARNEGEKVLLDEVRKEIKRRGLDGKEEFVIHGGKISTVKDPQTGAMVPLKVKRYSDVMLMFYAKRLDPQFRDNFPSVNILNQGPSSVRIILAGSDEDTDESRSRIIDVGSGKSEEDSGLSNLREEE